MMKYENRVVLFLDILGFRKHVLDTVGNDNVDNEWKVASLYDTLINMGNIAGVREGTNSQVMVTQFSDSIVISFKEEDASLAFYTFDVILKIIIELAINKIICRGALSYGKLHHDKNILFGPALIDAYETESKAAMYPRVIMDRNIYNLARMYNDKKGNIVIPAHISDYLNIDLDGKYYIDYFKAAHHVFSEEKNLQSYYDILRDIIINGSKFQQPDLKVKYGWMKQKYNNLLGSFRNDEYNSTFSSEFVKYMKGLKYLKL